MWTHFCEAASPKDKPLKLAEIPLDWDAIKSTAPGNDINIPSKSKTNQTALIVTTGFDIQALEQRPCVCVEMWGG